MCAARLIIATGLCLLAGCHSSGPHATDPLPAIEPSDVLLASHVEPASPPFQMDSASVAPTPVDLAAAPLTLGELEQLALANHPAISQTAARVRAMRGAWVQGGLPPNLTIGYMANEMGDAGTAGMQGGFVGQQFITGGKLGLNRAVAAQQIAAAEQQLASVRQRVLTDVRLGYYDMLIAQRRLALAHDLVHISRQAVEASEQLLAAEEIPRVGLLQTEVEARNVQIVLRRAENELAGSWRRLTSVLGLPELRQVHVDGDLEFAPTLHFEEELKRIVAQSPEVAAAAADVARARWAVERAYAEVVPDITAQAAVMHDNASGDTVASVQAGLPLPLWNKNQGGIARAQAEAFAAERDLRRLELDLRQRLAVAFQQYADARYQTELFSAEILPKATETLQLVTTGYRQGEVGYLDLLAAQRTYFQTRLDYLEAVSDLWQATLRIEGMLLEGGLRMGGEG